VTIEFTELDDRTEVVLTHTQLAQTKVKETNEGWVEILATVEGLVR
jgi:hypothetical protein